MSVQSLPLLFINLGGEMLYILDQRLKAQAVPSDKSGKVLTDIVTTMFNKKFIEELFTPQDVYSKRSLYILFEKVAHASIMHLNAASMDKLYDLMMMAFKYQLLMCQSPSELLPITLNHLDAIRRFVSQPNVVHQVEFVYNLLIQKYKDFTASEFQFVRHSLLNFFQGLHIRVSMFLQRNVQKPNGHFVVSVNGTLPFGTIPPGAIKTYDASGKMTFQEVFQTGCKYTVEKRRSSISVGGDRVTSLGTNMYSDNNISKNLFCAVESPADTQSTASTSDTICGETMSAKSLSSPDGKNELKLLAQLLGSAQPSSQPSMMFTLNLNSHLSDEENKTDASPVIKIDATKRQDSAALASIMEDLILEGDHQHDNGPDLLDLMDS